uniref:Uncharacterized protein n=1 Tax=Glycine max TaxID=3847 RepID=C6T754_SOYBN|nr:unknown [Glycine max]
MGFSEKAQLEGAFDSDTNNNNRKWVIAGIALRAPLKPIYTIPMEKEQRKRLKQRIVQVQQHQQTWNRRSQHRSRAHLLPGSGNPRRRSAIIVAVVELLESSSRHLTWKPCSYATLKRLFDLTTEEE